MPLVNHVKREIHAKLVLYGPAGSGKKTSLSYIYRKLKPECRGTLKTMNIQNDKMVFFDFFPGSKSEMGGYAIQYHLYTVSGANVADSSWRMVLKGADGIVFVADSDPDLQAANRESGRVLEQFLTASGMSLQGLPLVIQCNKRDVQGAVSLDDIRSNLSLDAAPVTGSTATTGAGVLEGLFTLINMVQDQLCQDGLDLKQDAEQIINEQEQIERDPAFVSASEPPLASDLDAEDASMAESDSSGISRPFVELCGDAVPFPGGLRLPLFVGYGNSRKKLTVTLSLSLDEEPQ